MNLARRELGPLKCAVLDALPDGAKPRLAVVLCHGVNAPADDLVGLGGEALELQSKLSATTRFYFPGGVMDSAEFGMPGGRAWWEIDWAGFTHMMQSGDYSPMYSANPPGLARAREALLGTLDAIRRETCLDTSRLVIGGFSQGAMLATDVTLRLDANPAALCVLSGSPLNWREWERLAPARRGLAVLQSHGRFDPVLPFAGAEKLRAMLESAGLEVEFVPFAGEHGIGMEALTRFAALLSRVQRGVHSTGT